MDINNKSSVESLLKKHQPWALVNAAGFVRVDDAESTPELCFKENAYGPVILAQACSKYDVSFLTFSTDLVFDGQTKNPYCEASLINPLNTYGASKAYAEKHVLLENPSALVVRTSAFFGPWDEFNFIAQMVSSVNKGNRFLVPNDQTITPTYIPDLVNNCLDLIIDQANGIFHLTNSTPLTWSEFALKAAHAAELDTNLIKPVLSANLSAKAKRPLYSALQSEKGIILPSLDDAISRYISARRDVDVKRRMPIINFASWFS